MPGKNVHTTYNHEARNWRNISEGAERPIKVYPTKQQAQEAGRKVAQERHVEHLIHNKDGEVGERNSYGHDPRDIKG